MHKGTAKGPIVAQVCACLLTPGVTDLHFLNPMQTIELEHIENKDAPSTTRFQLNGEWYYWKGYSELICVETAEIIAEFIPSWTIAEAGKHELGRLIVHCQGEEAVLRDVAVATALVGMERCDEGREAVPPVVVWEC